MAIHTVFKICEYNKKDTGYNLLLIVRVSVYVVVSG